MFCCFVVDDGKLVFYHSMGSNNRFTCCNPYIVCYIQLILETRCNGAVFRHVGNVWGVVILRCRVGRRYELDGVDRVLPTSFILWAASLWSNYSNYEVWLPDRIWNEVKYLSGIFHSLITKIVFVLIIINYLIRRSMYIVNNCYLPMLQKVNKKYTLFNLLFRFCFCLFPLRNLFWCAFIIFNISVTQ